MKKVKPRTLNMALTPPERDLVEEVNGYHGGSYKSNVITLLRTERERIRGLT